MGGISSTPSFQMMVNALFDWEERFSTFLARPPHPAHVYLEGYVAPPDQPPTMVPVLLRIEDVDAIVAFARSLMK